MKKIIEDDDTTQSKIFTISIQLLILFSIIAFCLETTPSLLQKLQTELDIFNAFSVTVFTVEYILRVAVSDKKIKFVLSFFGIVDLLAILPFYLSTGLDLRSLRAFRFLRFFRTMKLLRYNRAIRHFYCAFKIAKEELVLFGLTTLLLLFFAAVGIYYFEHSAQPETFRSIFDSLWWAVATLTTVGYGDLYPITPGGRFFTFIILIIGLGIVAVPSGLIASALSEARRLEEKEN
ncbi:voltage-gated potassium channel [Picosynechococcus sp. PCC 8807]|nr:voltage-gated potassium channel [Picosynechococcus sp. PCC 8807]